MRVMYVTIFLLSMLIVLGADLYFPALGTALVIAASLYVIGKIVNTKSKTEMAHLVILLTASIAITKKSIGYFSSGYIVNSVLGYRIDHSLSMMIVLALALTTILLLKAKRQKI